MKAWQEIKKRGSGKKEERRLHKSTCQSLRTTVSKKPLFQRRSVISVTVTDI
jgi:hypothetical protein